MCGSDARFSVTEDGLGEVAKATVCAEIGSFAQDPLSVADWSATRKEEVHVIDIFKVENQMSCKKH